MNETQQNLEDGLFEAAMQKPSPAERSAFLDGACRDNPALRARLDVLLEGHFAAQGFITPSAQRAASTAPTAPLDEAAGTVIGRYKLLQKIGEGGCGVVYMAEQLEPVRRRVALKIVKLGMDTRQVIARFEAERQALALMDHPNIARVLDGGTTGFAESPIAHRPSQIPVGRPYFVMELVRGVRLTEFCDERRLSRRERLELFVQVCHAIQHAHQKGIIHRDLKPSNILVTLNDGVPVPKVIDFGIAKATQGNLTDKTLFTMFEHFIGTPAYMSPEQAEVRGVDIDTRSDIYSLGVVLYELLTGRTPFDSKALLARGIEELILTLRQIEPPRPSTRLSTLAPADLETVARAQRCEVPKLVPGLRGDLDWIVMKCLEKDRARRYDTANGLAADLQRHLANEPVVARPPSAAYKLQKAWQRNRLAFTSAAIVAVALLVGSGVSTWQAVEATRARAAEARQHRAADQARAKAQAAQSLAEQETRKTQEALVGSRHEQGKALLVMARGRLEQQDVFGAKLIAASAIGFSGFGRDQQNAAFATTNLDLLRPGSAERAEVTRLLRGQPDFMRLWASPSVRHGGASVVGLAATPDGRTLISADRRGAISRWNLASGDLLSTFSTQDDGSGLLRKMDLSPDGRWLATASDDATIKVWNASTWQPQHLLTNPAPAVVMLRFSPDSKTLVSASAEGVLRVWDTDGFREQPALEGLPLRGEVRSLEIHPQGRFLLAAVRSGERPWLWDLQTGERVDLGLDTPVERPVAFSADGRWLTMIQKPGNTNYSVNLYRWELEGGRPRITAVATQAIAGSFRSLAFSPDSQTVVSAGPDGMIYRFSIPSLAELPPIKSQWREVECLAFTPDGTRLFSAGGPVGAIRSFELPSGKPKWIPETHVSGVARAVFSPHGRLFASAGSDGDVRLWDTATGRTRSLLRGSDGAVNDVIFRPDGLLLASASDDGTIRLWDTATGAERGVLRGHRGAVRCLAAHPAGQVFASGGRDGSVRFWTWDGKETHRINGRGKEVRALAFSPGGRQVAFAQEQDIELWDWAQAKAVRPPLAGHATGVGSIAFSPDGTMLASGGDGLAHGETRLWDMRTGATLQRWHEDYIFATARVAFTPDGRYFLREQNGQVEWYEVGREQGITTRPLAVLNKRIHDPIQSLALSPDGRLLLTAHLWTGLELWEVSRGREMMEWSNPDGDEFSAWGADLSPDGRLLATGTRNGLIRIWELATGRLLDSLKAEGTLNGEIDLTRQLLNASSTPKDSLAGVQFSPDGKRLYAAHDRSGVIRIWQFNQGWREAAAAVNGQLVLQMQLSPDGALLATTSYGAVRIWDANHLGEPCLAKLNVGAGWPGRTVVSFHPTRPRLAVNASDAVHVFDLTDPRSPRPVQRISPRSFTPKYSPDGQHLLIGQQFGPERLLDAETGGLVRSLGPTDPTRWACDFSPDGRWLALGSEQKMVRIWDLKTGEAVAVLPGHADWVNHVEFTPDGQRLVTVCSQTVRVWDLDRVLHASPDYAGHLEDFKLEGEKVVAFPYESVRSTNLYRSLVRPFRTSASGSLLGYLKGAEDRGPQNQRLFWHYYRASELAAARAVLEAMETTGQAREEREALATLCRVTALGSLENQRVPLAQRQIELALALAPEDPKNWQAKADILVKDGDYAQALSAADRAIQLAPQASEAWAIKATVLGKLSHEEASKAAWTKAIDLGSERQKEAYLSLSQAGQPTPPIPDARGWIRLFDGRTLSGWTAPDPSRWQMIDGELTGQGARSHLFSPNTYTNLEFRAEVKLAPSGNGGMYFRAACKRGWGNLGYEAQLANNTPDWERQKTGSLYSFQPFSEPLVEDNVWFTQHVVAIGNRIIIKINDRIITDFVDEKNTYTSGHLALQQFGTAAFPDRVPPGPVITFRNVMVKPLPDDALAAWAEAKKDLPEIQ